MDWIFIVGALFIFTGVATVFGRKRLAHISALCSVIGLGLIGFDAIWTDFTIVSVMLAMLCWSLALVMIITGAMKEHRRHQRIQHQKGEEDAREGFHA